MASTSPPNRPSSGSHHDLDITVKVLGEIIPLTIDRRDEQSIRSAAQLINRLHERYRQRYGEARVSELELLKYTALHLAIKVEQQRLSTEEVALQERLETLKEKLETALYPFRQE